MRLRPRRARQPSAAPYLIRPYSRRDLEGVRLVEVTAFQGQPTYPSFFFAQAGEILSNGFFVVIDPTGAIAAYVLVLLDQDCRTRGWILSLATHPDHQRRGLARQLMILGEERLTLLGATEALLTVAETNKHARLLYETIGYMEAGYAPDALGPAASRIFMRKPLQPHATSLSMDAVPVDQTVYDPSLILGEAQSSIDFVNILFAVSLAVLAITVHSLEDEPVVALLLFMIVISSFYASVFYAVVAGNVARLSRFSDVDSSIRYGNVLSEYFGVYLVVVTFPLVVYTVAANRSLALLALCVDFLGFLFYIGSSFDLISRSMPNRIARTLFHTAFLGLATVLLHAVSYDQAVLATACTGLIVMGLTGVSLLHLRRGEQRGDKVST